MSNGLPSWNTLIEALIDAAVSYDNQLAPEDGVILKAYLQESGISGLEVADLLSGLMGSRAFRAAVQNALYREASFRYPHDLLRSVAGYIALRASMDRQTVVMTLNFDNLLERFGGEAAAREGVDPVSFVPGYDGVRLPSEGEVVVHHLHGYLPSDLSVMSDEIVLTLSQFSRNWSTSWSDQVFESLPVDSTWLLLGLSMTDTHVLEYLLQRRAESPTFVVMSRDDRSWRALSPAAQRKLEGAFMKRLGTTGAAFVLCDWRHEIACMFDDASDDMLSDARSDPLRRPTYPDRLVEWWDAIDHYAHLRLAPIKAKAKRYRFTDSQLTCSEHLASLRDQVSLVISDHFGDQPESLKMELWLRSNPREGRNSRLILVSHSDMFLMAPELRPSLSLAGQLVHSAAIAFTGGDLRISETESSTSAWKTYLGTPIRMEWDDLAAAEATDIDVADDDAIAADPWRGLMVGALVIASNSPQSRLRIEDVREDVAALCLPRIRRLLDPSLPDFFGP